MQKDTAPIHPGEILKEDFLDPMGVSAYRLAKATHVLEDRVSKIIHGKRSITGDTTLRFGRYFGVEPQFWLNLQARYDLDIAEDALGETLELEIMPLEPA